jgi:hypothetical protein
MKRTRKLLYLCLAAYLLMIIFSSGEATAQTRICKYCGEKITSGYIIVDGDYYHPYHFLCAKCNQPIGGNYQKKDNLYYHPQCYPVEQKLVCAYCNEPITGPYISSGGKFYHSDCYHNNVILKCAVCGQPITGVYRIDPFGNKFHPYHTEEMQTCNNCGRIICPTLTNGGKSYGDGRNICNICYQKSVFRDSDFGDLMNKVLLRFDIMNMHLQKESINIKGVNLLELKRVAGSNSTGDIEGFCVSETHSEFVNGQLRKKIITHSIYVLNGIPALNLESIIAHELMHAWIYENTKSQQPLEIIEGSCNYIAYLYLMASQGPESDPIIKRMEQNPDPMYGKAFMKIKEEFSGISLSSFLDYLKTYR